MKYIKIILLFIIPSIIGCDDVKYPKSSIQIKNDSNFTISTFLALSDHVGFAYPDTILPENKIDVQVARPNQSNYYDFGFSIDELFSALPSDTLSIYYFATDTLNKYSWSEIVEGYKVLKRDDLSISEVTDNDYLLITFE